jgi:hypothetical protein
MLQEFGRKVIAIVPGGNRREYRSADCEDASPYIATLFRGIEASKPFVGNRMWVTSLTDLTVIESTSKATPVPEDTEFSEQESY